MAVSYQNRIYLEPVNRQAISISLGPMLKGYQKYPPFEPWMTAYVSQETYNRWIQWLQQKLEEVPFDDSCLCCKTCFYGCCCCCSADATPARLKDFNVEVCSGFTELMSESGIPAVLEVEEFKGFCGNCCGGQTSRLPWVDSAGQPYVVYGKYGPRPAGKPPGYNIVITLAEPIPWPPPAQPIIIVQPGVQLPPQQQPFVHQPSTNPLVPPQAPPPYYASTPEQEGQRFCVSCGAQLVEGSKFCGNCGAAAGF